MPDPLADLFVVTANLVLGLPGHRLRVEFLRRACGWTVGEGTVVERGIRITTKGGVEIGRGCVVNTRVVLDGRGRLVIGDHVNISPEVACLTADHDPESSQFRGRFRPVTIGSRSWLATRAMVLPGATVGEGCVVAAGAVVTGETPEWSVVAGVPARKLCSRPTTAQQQLPSYRRWLH